MSFGAQDFNRLLLIESLAAIRLSQSIFCDADSRIWRRVLHSGLFAVYACRMCCCCGPLLQYPIPLCERVCVCVLYLFLFLVCSNSKTNYFLKIYFLFFLV